MLSYGCRCNFARHCAVWNELFRLQSLNLQKITTTVSSAWFPFIVVEYYSNVFDVTACPHQNAHQGK